MNQLIVYHVFLFNIFCQMFDTVSLFAKLCQSGSNLEVIHPDKPVRKLYHRREKKRQGLY